MARLKSASSLLQICLRQWIEVLTRLDLLGQRALLAQVGRLLPPTLAGQLVTHTMQDGSLEPELKVATASTLLECHSLPELSFTFLNEYFYSEIAQSLLESGSGLRKLDLYGVWLSGEKCNFPLHI